jgi:hypothetical protein
MVKRYGDFIVHLRHGLVLKHATRVTYRLRMIAMIRDGDRQVVATGSHPKP